MEYIKRDLERKIRALIEDYSCILITEPPRQVGKQRCLRIIQGMGLTALRLYSKVKT